MQNTIKTVSWDPIINLIRNYLAQNIIHSTQSILNLQKKLDPVLSKYKFECDIKFPYGRYLVFEDDHGLFNIQIDVFSENYVGMIHSHSTWGILHVIQGKLFVEEWNQENKNNFKLFGGLALNEKSSQSFCPPTSDLHKVSTNSNKKQTISLHIYGEGFDVNEGIYLNKKLEPVSSKRSKFRDIKEIIPYCIFKD